MSDTLARSAVGRREMPSGDPVDISRLIDASPIGAFQLTVVGLAAAVVLLDGFDVQTITYASPALTQELGIARPMLGPVFSAGLVGTTLGAFAFGLLADRFGRKPMFIGCTLLFGLCSLATATAGSVSQLIAWRFVAGLGLGGATPIAVALASEFCSEARRETLVMLMYCGFSVGAAGGGFFGAWLIPAFGWRSVFLAGGALPLLLTPLLVWWLPESIRFLVARGQRPHEVARTVRRLDPSAQVGTATCFQISEESPKGFPVGRLFADGRAATTLLLWLMFFSNLIALYFLINWFPTLGHAAGLTLREALLASALIQVGSIAGTFLLAVFVRRRRAFSLVAGGFLLGAVAIATLAAIASSPTGLMIGGFITGFFVIGTQTGANAMSAMLYPTTIRSTGIGWALGVGRSGSILGPLVGGALLSLHWSTAGLFLIAAVPAAVAAAAAFGISRQVGQVVAEVA